VRSFFVAIFLLPTPPALQAQSPSGTISGAVLDASGAVVPRAAVQIVNAETNVNAWSGLTSQEGTFLAPMLNVGSYNISIGAPGFKKFEILALVLEVNKRARVDAVLQPGELKEVITVTGESVAMLNKEDSTVGLDINPSEIREIPLANRDIFNLLNLSAGVSAGGDATAINSAQYSVNGSRTQASEVTVDGVSVVGGSTGSTLHIPSTEAIRQVKILASTYSAEFGRTSGAAIAAVVDSGSSRYHGGAYEYFRNEALNANNFFNNLRGAQRPYDRQNQFGAKFSGPVSLPKIYPAKDRTFFFVNYEGNRRLAPANNISTLPDTKFITGDFSSSPVIVSDRLASNRPAFPGNRIPASRLDPAGQKIVRLLPPPNSPGTFDAITGLSANNYVNQVFTHPSSDDLSVRVDHSISSNHRLFGRLTSYRSSSPTVSVVEGLFNPGSGGSTSLDYNAAVGLTSTLTPTLIFELRASYVRDLVDRPAPSLGVDVAGVMGIQRFPISAAPSLSITGFTTTGSQGNSWQRIANNIYQYAPSLTWVKGRHTLRAGMQGRRHHYNVFASASNFAGGYSFTGEISAPNTTGGNSINALADFLLGDVKTASYTISQPMNGHRGYNLAGYIQDDWKITQRLTLNLGLREEYESPMTVANHMYSRIDLLTGKLLVAGKNASESLNQDPPKLNFGPRVGFAYALGSKTVIRSAFGVFFYQLFANLGGPINYPGYTLTQLFNSVSRGVPQSFPLSQGMPQTLVPNYEDPFVVERNATPSSPLAPSAQFSNVDHLPENLQWNFGIQREFARGTMADVSYVGSHAYHLPLYILENSLDSFKIAEAISASGSSVATQITRKFPNLTSWNSISNVGSSAYHSLQARLTREVSRSVSAIATYTFSKSMDDGSGTFTNTQPAGFVSQGQLPQLARNLEHGPSAFDRRHILTVMPRYTTWRGPKWLRDFNFSGVFSGRSGLPVSIRQNNLFPDGAQQRPNIVGPGSQLYMPGITTVGTGLLYLRPPTDPKFPLFPTGPLFATVNGKSVMVLPAALGNLGPMVVRVPGDVNLNFAVGKRIPLREKLALQIRAEAFNAFNHTNLMFPATQLNVVANAATQTGGFNSPGYGLITSARSARFMQLVARIEF
jgi:Carboxypeptidase regulatory-like domain/TonB-dependent Receptor Plug Domain